MTTSEVFDRTGQGMRGSNKARYRSSVFRSSESFGVQLRTCNYCAEQVWSIRIRHEIAENHHDLALFNLAIDIKRRGWDLVKLKVADVYASGQAKERSSIIQSKTQRPDRFEITDGTRKSILRWMEEPLMIGSAHLWPGRFRERLHISTRQSSRLVREWVNSMGLDPTYYALISSA